MKIKPIAAIPFLAKKTILLFALFNLTLLYGTFAQNINTIKGTVTNGKGEPLTGATVQVLDSKYAALTDATGNYTLRNIPFGNYTITVMYIGYIQKIQKLELRDSATVNVLLLEDVLKLQDVVVTGAGGSPHKKIESSVAVTTVSSKDIALRAPLNSTDLLKAVPGLTVETSSGDGPGNVWVRGFPQQGGYIFLGIMEDGLPLLPTGFNSVPSIDQYYKTDLTIKNVEVIRGGDASIIMANTPGAVVNNLSYTGSEKPYGQLKFTDGLSQNMYRGDANFGGRLSSNIKYNIGGFYRTDQGIVSPGYAANLGGQLKGNVTFGFKNKKGFVRLYGKYLNDRVEWMQTSYYPYNGSGKPTTYGNYDMVTQSMLPTDTKWSWTDGSGISHDYDLKDGIHTKSGSAQMQFHYATDNGWQINNNFRYQDTYNNTTANIPAGISAYNGTGTYYYLGGAVAPLKAGDQIVTDYSLAQTNHDIQFVDFLDFKKKLKNQFLTLGAAIHQYNRTDSPDYTFYSIQEFKANPRRLLTTSTGNGMTEISATSVIGNTRSASAYVSDEITLNPKWRLDIGARLDNQNVQGQRSLSAVSISKGYIGYNETVTNWAASAGANYKISGTTAMFARVTRAYNAPNITDYNATSYNPASIKKRPVYLAEIGVKYAKDNFSLFASGSYSAIKNVSLTIAVPTSAGLQSLLAFGSTRTWSAEYEASYKPIKQLTLRLTGTLQNSKYTDYTAITTESGPVIVAALGDTTYSYTGKKTERVPTLNTEISATYEYKKFNLYLSTNYIGSRFTSPADNYTLPAYMTMAGGAGYNFTKQLGVRFWVNNLTNTRALSQGNVRGDQFTNFANVAQGALQNGKAILQRSFWASVSYSFQ